MSSAWRIHHQSAVHHRDLQWAKQNNNYVTQLPPDLSSTALCANQASKPSSPAPRILFSRSPSRTRPGKHFGQQRQAYTLHQIANGPATTIGAAELQVDRHELQQQTVPNLPRTKSKIIFPMPRKLMRLGKADPDHLQRLPELWTAAGRSLRQPGLLSHAVLSTPRPAPSTVPILIFPTTTAFTHPAAVVWARASKPASAQQISYQLEVSERRPQQPAHPVRRGSASSRPDLLPVECRGRNLRPGTKYLLACDPPAIPRQRERRQQ